jgi:hypothetical protein
MPARKKGPEPGSVYTQSKAMKDVFTRGHKKREHLKIVYLFL